MLPNFRTLGLLPERGKASRPDDNGFKDVPGLRKADTNLKL